MKVVGAFEGTPLPPYLTSDDVLASGDVVVDDIAYDDQHGMTKERKIASATLPQSLIDPHRYIKRKAAERPNRTYRIFQKIVFYIKKKRFFVEV